MSDTKITVRNNGPLLVSGPVMLEDASGQSFGLAGRATIALCRCGASENKPFCDGSHARTGFKSECPARDLQPPAPKP
ncbi:MAG TPA: CDGSH iron-sulfur domain-containing protein [Thermoanaerobaculia bacterium]|nr:CDGSH iron-sulfur domain-containing protein [Thermoanaerobaculia bacterium]